MRRFQGLFLCALAVGGCRIEPTPQRYIDPQQIPADEIRQSEEELRRRLLSIPPALQRRSAAEVARALTPHAELYAFGPGPGETLTDAAAIATVLNRLADGAVISVEDFAVTVGPRNNVAWFRSEYLVHGDLDVGSSFLLSGVFVRQEGEWRLIQAHISMPITPAPPEAAGAADTPAEGG